jgi:hypothetical protein
VDGDKCQPVFTEAEKKTNLSVVWLPLDEAIKAVERSGDSFEKTRSLLILEKFQKEV